VSHLPYPTEAGHFGGSSIQADSGGYPPSPGWPSHEAIERSAARGHEIRLRCCHRRRVAPHEKIGISHGGHEHRCSRAAVRLGQSLRPGSGEPRDTPHKRETASLGMPSFVS
jgi:hypothetical protein